MIRPVLLAAALAALPALLGASPFTAVPVPAEFTNADVSSRYLPMRDGVRVAVDVLLPQGLSAARTIPAVLHVTRYGRAPVDGSVDGVALFWVRHGYAYVAMDERGTGASFGTLRYGKATLGDMRELVDWVVKQPWSNGRVASIGTSYEGTTAELLAATGHPAVRAVAPLFSDYDYYTDLIRPGGILNDWGMRVFRDETAKMDAGAAAKPVDGDTGGALAKAAVAEHARNPDVYEAARAAEFTDDALRDFGGTARDISITGVRAELLRARVPMLVFASWYDAGTVQGTLARFTAFGNVQRAFVGPWNHGGSRDANPFLPLGTPADPGQAQQYREAVHFFDHYLKDTPDAAAEERRLYYFTTGENAWHSTAVWPPAGSRRTSYHLAGTGRLQAQPGAATPLHLSDAPTGERDRWHSQLTGDDIAHADVARRLASLPAFTSEPLAQALELTGQPVLRLRLTSSIDDPSVFAYLFAVGPRGDAVYLTDGMLRLRDRKLDSAAQTLHSYARRDALPVPRDAAFDAAMTLLPLSARVPAGYRLRVALAAANTSTFATAGPFDTTIDGASQIDLPVAETAPAR
jgi:uncharacterized protein